MVFILKFKKEISKGFALVEMLVVLIVVSLLAGITTLASNNVINRTEINVDISTLKSLNTATAVYRATENSSLNNDIFYGLNNDKDRLQKLLESGQISNIPIPNDIDRSFRWNIASQRWVMDGHLLTFLDLKMGTKTSQKSWILGYKSSYKYIVIPNSINGIAVKEIRSKAFYEKDLISVTIEDGITYIRQDAFRNNDLADLVLPNTLLQIDTRAFMNNNLTEITLPSSLINIGTQAFRDNNLTTVVFPNSLTSIANQVFQNNKLTELSLPNSLTSIGSQSFRDNNLTTIVLPNSLTSIGTQAFRNNGLTQVALPNSINVGTQAFLGNNINTITIGTGVTLGSKVFGNSNSFRTAYNAGGTGTYILVGPNWVKQ